MPMHDVTERFINATQKHYFFSPKISFSFEFQREAGSEVMEKTDMTEVTKENLFPCANLTLLLKKIKQFPARNIKMRSADSVSSSALTASFKCICIHTQFIFHDSRIKL